MACSVQRWSELTPAFRSQVLGPCFESMARYWTTHFAARETLGGPPDHVGPTTLTVTDGETGVEESREIDVVVAADDAATERADLELIDLVRLYEGA